MNNLKVRQNQAAKIFLDRPFHSSATDKLNGLGWLNLEQRRLFHRCLYVYKCVIEITSHSMELLENRDVHNYNTRTREHLRLIRVTRNCGKQRSNYQAINDCVSLRHVLMRQSIPAVPILPPLLFYSH